MKRSMPISLFVVLAAGANAETIYNTYGNGGAYDDSTGWSVNPSQTIATPFVIRHDAFLSSITLSLQEGSPYTIRLTKGGSIIPGETLATWSFETGGTHTLTPSSAQELATGSYYVVAESTGSGAWCWNSVDTIDVFSGYHPAQGWYSDFGITGVMRVDVTPVPEPMTCFALGVGLLLTLRRKRQK